MYGDPQAVHGLARQARLLAQRTRSDAARVQAARSVDWHSDLAERLRRDLADQARGTGASAAGLDALATALDAHADAVAARLAQIRAAERFLAGLVDAARHRAAVAAQALQSASTGAAVQVAERGEQLATAAVHELMRAPATGTAELVDYTRRHGFPGGW